MSSLPYLRSCLLAISIALLCSLSEYVNPLELPFHFNKHFSSRVFDVAEVKSMAKKIVVAGGNGFLGTTSPS